MTNLDQHKVVVVVFAMHECPACEHFLPRFLAEVEALRQQGFPFEIYGPGKVIGPNKIPVLVYDAASPNADVQRFADRFAVSATPSTVIVSRGTGAFKAEGSMADNQIRYALMLANEANA